MRINKFVALATGISRRAADTAVENGRVYVNGERSATGQDIISSDKVTLDGRAITTDVKIITIMLNKPVGFVCSRDGQGSKTIYDILPLELRKLKPVGRLDKYSSGLLLLTNDGQLAQELTHPSRRKNKIYEVTLSTDLQPLHRQMIEDHGITLHDGVSKLRLQRLHEGNEKAWQVTMHEGRNRQIRRTFAALGYNISTLHRTQLGPYRLGQLASGQIQTISTR
ncbi:pseudouridine synthase [soil metagenome]